MLTWFQVIRSTLLGLVATTIPLIGEAPSILEAFQVALAVNGIGVLLFIAIWLLSGMELKWKFDNSEPFIGITGTIAVGYMISALGTITGFGSLVSYRIVEGCPLDASTLYLVAVGVGSFLLGSVVAFGAVFLFGLVLMIVGFSLEGTDKRLYDKWYEKHHGSVSNE